jgi:hypothetical protein
MDAQPVAEGEPLKEPDAVALALARVLLLPLSLRVGVCEALPEAVIGTLGMGEPVTEAHPLSLAEGGARVGLTVGEVDAVEDWDAEGVAEPPLPQPEEDIDGDAEARALLEEEREPVSDRDGGGEAVPVRDGGGEREALGERLP